MSHTSELRITSLEDGRLLGSLLVVLRSGIRRVRLETNVLSLGEKDRVALEDRLNHKLTACGCGTGTAFLVPTIAIWSLCAYQGLWPTSSVIITCIAIVATLLLSAAAGKFLGRLYALHQVTKIAKAACGVSALDARELFASGDLTSQQPP